MSYLQQTPDDGCLRLSLGIGKEKKREVHFDRRRRRILKSAWDDTVFEKLSIVRKCVFDVVEQKEPIDVLST